MLRRCLAISLGVLGLSQACTADLPTDQGVVLELSAPSPHWVWVDDVVFFHMADGKAYLIDGDTGTFLGMLNTGFSFEKLDLPRNRRAIYAAEIYFSRGTRGERTDVVTIYDPRKLAPTGEISIPSKRSSNMPMLGNSALTDDDRFLLIYNFTPAMSVSVVDVEERRFAGEISTPGCALIYPSGERSFFMLCGDGQVLTIRLDNGGKEAERARSAPIFDPADDPVTEKGVRYGDQWLFASFRGDLLVVDVSGSVPELSARWSLLGDADRAGSWRPGGMQHLAVHEDDGLLYSLMHQGGPGSHKDPGKDVWVYDLEQRQRVRRIELQNLATSIQVTRDDQPLLFSIFIASPTLDVYDARSGQHLRTVAELGFSPTLLQLP